jgi:hypothetical protein
MAECNSAIPEGQPHRWLLERDIQSNTKKDPEKYLTG